MAELPPGSRITDYLRLDVIGKYFLSHKANEILSETGKSSIRQRELPAHVVVNDVVALAFHMPSSHREILRCLPERIQWLRHPVFP
jgi:hypothetical protein